MPAAVCSVTTDRVVRVNPGFTAAYGFAEDALGRPLRDLHFVAEDRDDTLRAFARAVTEYANAMPAEALPDAAFAAARGTSPGEEAEEPLLLPELPHDPKALGVEVLSDPELTEAYRDMRQAVRHEKARPIVLRTLKAFAQEGEAGKSMNDLGRFHWRREALRRRAIGITERGSLV